MRKNPGEGELFYFHGAFTDKKDAKAKKDQTPNAFLKTVWYRSGPRYAVLTPRRENNPSELPRWRKPASEITDNARLRRSYHPSVRPRGPKKCKLCGSQRFVVIDHKNGNNADIRRSNLRFLCTSCNTRRGIAMKKAGKGIRERRTKSQDRPKVGSLVRLRKPMKKQRVLTSTRKKLGAKRRNGVVTAMRHVARAAAEMVLKRAVRKRRKTRKAVNPSAQKKAARAYAMFHGRKPRKVSRVVAKKKSLGVCADYAKLGDLVSLRIAAGRITFKPGQRPVLATDAQKKKLYIIGGDQKLKTANMQCKRRNPDGVSNLGKLLELEYYTRKKFDGFTPVIYYHELGEESGKRPDLLYDERDGVLLISGGDYKIKPEGIVN